MLHFGLSRLQAWEDEGGRIAVANEPLRILIVDNDISSAVSLELMLQTSGYSLIRVAYSGHAALAIAAEFLPDVVLLELGLLDMNSYELAQLLREHATPGPAIDCVHGQLQTCGA